MPVNGGVRGGSKERGRWGSNRGRRGTDRGRGGPDRGRGRGRGGTVGPEGCPGGGRDVGGRGGGRGTIPVLNPGMYSLQVRLISRIPITDLVLFGPGPGCVYNRLGTVRSKTRLHSVQIPDGISPNAD